MLHAQNLTKRYNGVLALDRLNLTVAGGEIFCLLGGNGAGKNTPQQGPIKKIEMDPAVQRTSTSGQH